LNGCEEDQVKNIHVARDMRPHDLEYEDKSVFDSVTPFTPGEFFKDAGTVIAVCLGLGLLMRILLG
jgi:hypothetical protein